MTANTGRTHNKWLIFKLDNGSGTLTDITAYVNKVGDIGLTYEPTDVTAFSDAVANVINGRPGAKLSIGGPVDTVVHTQMTAITGGVTPLSLDVQLGIRHAWEAGEPQYGITSSSTVGYVVTKYIVNGDDMTWTADLDVMGATAPAWGTAAES